MLKKGANVLSMQVDEIVIDLLYNFKKSLRRKATLRDYITFTNTEVTVIIKHVTTCWLSLGKSLDRALLQWDVLECYVQSVYNTNL